MGIWTPQPLPEGPAFGAALGEELRGPYAHIGPQRRDRTVKTASPPHTPHHPFGGRQKLPNSPKSPCN